MACNYVSANPTGVAVHYARHCPNRRTAMPSTVIDPVMPPISIIDADDIDVDDGAELQGKSNEEVTSTQPEGVQPTEANPE